MLATRVLPASPNFGQAKHGQKSHASNFCPKSVCSPMYTGLFTFYDPSQYLRFQARGQRVKKFHFSICLSARIFFGGLLVLRPLFWCHRLFTLLVWTVILQSFQGYPKSWPGVKRLASRSSQSEVMPIFVRAKRPFLGIFFKFPGQMVDFCL